MRRVLWMVGVWVLTAGLLAAPEFLFRLDGTRPDPAHPGRLMLDPSAKAARLSFLLWNTTPDEALLAQCDLDRFRASGPGGQKRNKTDSAVRLRHRPSGLVGEANESRSQHENRARALRRHPDQSGSLDPYLGGHPRRPGAPAL